MCNLSVGVYERGEKSGVEKVSGDVKNFVFLD